MLTLFLRSKRGTSTLDTEAYSFAFARLVCLKILIDD